MCNKSDVCRNVFPVSVCKRVATTAAAVARYYNVMLYSYLYTRPTVGRAPVKVKRIQHTLHYTYATVKYRNVNPYRLCSDAMGTSHASVFYKKHNNTYIVYNLTPIVSVVDLKRLFIYFIS